MSEKKQGLYTRYTVTKNHGETDPNAEYFVLRLDNGGSDKSHITACRKAILVYASEIAVSLPELSRDLIKKYGVPQ